MNVFYTIIASLLLLGAFTANNTDATPQYIYTVKGKIPVKNLNFSLTHEHIMSNFGAEATYVAKYDTALLVKQVVPYLKIIKSQGVVSIFDCTAAYFGRDVNLLKALSDSTGMQIITNTGFYGASNDIYIPKYAFKATEKELARLWIAEFENGINQTGIKPGFIKLGFDEGEPSEIDIKLFRAGILTHLKTGLTMVVHTGNNPNAANLQLKLLNEKKVKPDAWVWAHANKITDPGLLIKAASKGAWISLDGVNESNVSEYVKKIEIFKTQKLLNKLLLSHDGNSFPKGGKVRKYEAIQNDLIPELLKLGYTKNDINQLMIKNPQEAFMIKVRKSN